MRTSEQIKTEIEEKFGFFPPFFGPALESPQVLENLWQQTLTAYVNNPLPPLFKEKLIAYLSRFCTVPYCMVCHSCVLRPLGMTAGEVLQWLEAPPPTEADIQKHFTVLTASEGWATFPSNSVLEEGLLYCAIYVFLEGDAAQPYQTELRRLLGTTNYLHLVAYIAYIKTCHTWMEANPEVSYEADQRTQNHLDPLLEQVPDLADFFRNYPERVRCERQSRTEHLVKLEAHQRNEGVLRQQIERERLVGQIAQHIRQSLNLEEILRTTVSEVRQFLQSDRVFIYRFRPDWSGVVVVESADPRWQPLQGRILTDPSFADYVESYKNGRIQATADIYTGGLTQCYIDFLVEFQVRAALVVPILQGQVLWGLLVANHCSAPRQWQQLEIDLLKQLATQVAIAIQQSDLYQQAQTELNERKRAESRLRARAYQQAVVAELGQRALAGIDLSVLMGEAVALIAQTLEVEYCKILELLPKSNTLLLRSGVGWGAGLVGQATVNAQADTQAAYTLASSEPVIVEDLRSETRFSGPPLLHDHGVISGLSVIIPGQNHPFGVLGAHTTRQRTFTQDDIYFLQAIANVLATAIERHQTEQKIHRQAALLDITTDAIFVHDLEHQILFWNKGAEHLYGWKAEEALGRNVNELLVQETPQLEEALKTALEQGEWQGELEQLTKSAQKVIVQSRWTLVREDQQRSNSILTVNTDITAKKQLEAQFLRAQRLESIGTLAGGIAHDLNNILTPILAAPQLLQAKFPDADEQSQRLLKIIETNAKRGADLVKQVLSFARGVEGKHTILQAKHLISEVKQIVKETFPKSIEVYTDTLHDLWTVWGDATQLHQVLMNLCLNARDAMPDGGTLSISAENLLIDQNYARMNLDAQVGPYTLIEVADTGTGMPPEVMDRVFEPFFTTKELGKGTGLGLSTVVGIVKSHGGFVNVFSQLGKGSQFKVYLPAVKGVETQQPEDLELPAGHGELILVVDDEVAIRDVTKTSLEAYGYKVLTARDGIEAVALYAQHREAIRVVLIDMIMPSMGGPTTIRTLQKINPRVKVVAVSGLSSSDQLTEAVGATLKAFLLKPYTAKELLGTLNKVLSSS